MEFIAEQLTGPTNPDDFVGRNDMIDKFHDLLMEFVRSNPTIRWIHVSGVAGVGKSSLLRKFQMMLGEERIASIEVEVPVSPKKANTFLTDVKFVIDETAPEWRNFIARKLNTEIASVIEPPEAQSKEVLDENIAAMVDQFFVDLNKVDAAMKKEKMSNAIVLDNLDRLTNYGYTSILSVFPQIAKKLKEEEYSLLLLTSGHYDINKYLGIEDAGSPDYVLHLQLEQFDFNEAELMVRRRGKLVKSDREIVVQASTRFPFDLALRQLMLSKDLDPTTLEAKVIKKAFGLTPQEVDLLKDLAKETHNFFNFEEYTRLHSPDTIANLTNALLFISTQDGYFAFDSRSMWELISHVFKPIDPRTEMILILDRLKYQAELGQMPSGRDFKIVADHFKLIQDDALLFELSGQLADAAKAALEGELAQTAWKMLQLATIGLERTEDYEKIADLQETIAKNFSKANHNYFAAKSFALAGEYFRKSGIEWRSVTNFREAGQKYQKEAESTNVEIYHYAIRAMLRNAYNAYMNANEPSRARRVLEQAQEMLDGYDNHTDYFKTIEVKSE